MRKAEAFSLTLVPFGSRHAAIVRVCMPSRESGLSVRLKHASGDACFSVSGFCTTACTAKATSCCFCQLCIVEQTRELRLLFSSMRACMH